MDGHPLRSVTRMTGLSPDVIRVWERRYGVVRPARGPRGARLYSDADVAHLRLLGGAVASGRAIGDVARLDDAALRALCGRAEAATAPADGAEVERLLAIVARFDAAALDRALGDALVAFGLREFTRRIATPLLTAVGDRWMDGRLTIADEHLVSASLRQLLTAIVRGRGHGPRPLVLLATPSGERHEFGLLLAALHLLEAGLGVCYLGPDLPADEIVAAARRAGVAVVGLGLVDTGNRARAAGAVREVARDLPAPAELWLGGPDAPATARASECARAFTIAGPDVLEREAERLRAVGWKGDGT